MDGRQRIALYGGTFDPVHVGHISVAQKLSQLFELERVLFIPACVAPHKRERDVTAALHRFAMLALATQHEPRLRVSKIELDAPEKPYTVETLLRLRSACREKARLFFVMGADSWSEITTWREWERVLTLTDHIVVARPGYELETGHVTPAIRERIVDLRGAAPEEMARAVGDAQGEKIYVTDAVVLDISATAVRRAVREGQRDEWLALVQPIVAEYIEKYRLYKDQHGTEYFD
ncbi:MAG TPA: nicotinate-nucleotide adenylyltransferase [Pyrinomonadaceae bacterium]|jgi:nicotinate-nucleotide adenylyltransferase